LIHATGSLKSPSVFLMAASAILLVICLKQRETFRTP
jgi:hypothetical protein